MGLQCAKAIQPSQHNTQSQRTAAPSFELRLNRELVTFQIRISNLRMINLTQNFHRIRIESSPDFNVLVPFQDFSFHQNNLICNNTYSTNFTTQIGQLQNRQVTITIQDRTGRVLDRLKMKLFHLSTGPVKHDHLLKQVKSRLLFQFHIDQELNVDVELKDLQIQWKKAFNYKDYTYSLSLIFSNSRNPLENSKKFQKHEKIKCLAIENSTIKNTELRQSILKFKMMDTLWDGQNFQFFVPYSKLQQQIGCKLININNKDYEVRQLKFSESLLMKGEVIGQIKFNLMFKKSRLYAEQMECVIFSENGIVTMTPSQRSNDSKDNKTLDQKMLSQFHRKLKYLKNYGMTEFQLYKLLEQIYITVVGKQFSLTDEVLNIQELLIDLMMQLQSLLEEDKELKNQYIWNIFNELCRKELLNLKYFCHIKNQQSKKRLSLKFYSFLAQIVKKIIQFTANGITYKEILCIHKFMAFVYFRFPWCQTQIISALSKTDDPVISEQKLAQIGASYCMKSPSKSYFFDWENSIYKLVNRDENFIQILRDLQKARLLNSKWALLLFDREYQQLFYGLYSQLWDEAFQFLDNNGKIMWEYFPHYGQLLSIFFGQMNNSGLTDFSNEMTSCNMKLIKNQKLLNTFMMLIFPKTCLYETYCVLKCLDLIRCYFKVLLDNKKQLPPDFHYNYFYIGLRSILQSNHSYLLQKMLALIYKFYSIFSDQFKITLNNYLLNKVFNQLFMHWSEDVRKIFHLLLVYKVFKFESAENPEMNFRKTKNGSNYYKNKQNYQHIIEELYSLKAEKTGSFLKKRYIKQEYYQKMQEKLKEKEKNRKRQESTLNYESQNLSEEVSPRKASMNQPVLHFGRRKWSLTDNIQQERAGPSEEQLKYMEASLKQFELAKKEPNPDERVLERSKMLQVSIDQ